MTLDDLKNMLKNMQEAQKAGSADISEDDTAWFAAFVQRYEDDALTEDDQNGLQLLQMAYSGELSEEDLQEELSDDMLEGVAGGLQGSRLRRLLAKAGGTVLGGIGSDMVYFLLP